MYPCDEKMFGQRITFLDANNEPRQAVVDRAEFCGRNFLGYVVREVNRPTMFYGGVGKDDKGVWRMHAKVIG
jgi:hypothetical protein